MEYLDFRAEVLKLKQKKNFKVKNSYGTNELYRLSKIKDVSYKLFVEILKKVHSLMIENLIQGKSIRLPEDFGIVEIRKNKPKIKLYGNKLKTTLPIDWKSTLLLWHSDSEAHKNKTIIRKEVPYIYSVFHKKKYSTFPYKNYYKLSLTRSNKLKIKESIDNQKIIAFDISND